ncbi:DUF397 domain-containing protein [Streptomyces sp. NPDC051776]|uniref:DUF397 domain-containing protein n=1 Tax=Streptomyces sp. NPDC051776 TaxID=3155414 RepID=UPI003449D41A
MPTPHEHPVPHTPCPPSTDRLPGLSWRRSSHSTGMNNCVETAVVGTAVPTGSADGSGRSGLRVAVRDSKDTAGPALLFSPAAWELFLRDVRVGRFGGLS